MNLEQKIFKKLLEVPKGQVTTYGELAKAAGLKNGQRVVGRIMNKNPYPVIIPCHRVVGSDGSLTGYAGGLWRKKWLLNHESKHKQQSLF